MGLIGEKAQILKDHALCIGVELDNHNSCLDRTLKKAQAVNMNIRWADRKVRRLY